MMRCHFSLLNFLFLFLGNSKSKSSRQVTWNGKRCPVPGSFHRNLPICLCEFPGPRGERFFTQNTCTRLCSRVLERDTPSLSNLAFAIASCRIFDLTGTFFPIWSFESNPLTNPFRFLTILCFTVCVSCLCKLIFKSFFFHEKEFLLLLLLLPYRFINNRLKRSLWNPS